MADVGKILKEEIRAVASRQIRTTVAPLKKEVQTLKRLLAQQRRLTSSLSKTVSRLAEEAEERRVTRLKATEEEVQSARLRSHNIRRLREKIEEDPSHPQLILTRTGIGYFLARVD